METRKQVIYMEDKANGENRFKEIFKIIFKGIELLTLIFMIVIFAFPFIWMISTSLKTTQEAIMIPPTIIPSEMMIENYIKAWSSGPFFRYLGNSLFITMSILVLQFVVMIPAAYAFSKFKFKGNKFLFGIILTGLMVPPQITFLPVYKMMSNLGLINTYIPLILPFITSSFGIFLLRQNFMQIPNEIIDAAKLDNSTDFKIMWKIMLPMAKPAMITFGLFSFIYHWNNYFWPLVMSNTDLVRTLPIGVAMLKDSEGIVNWNVVMAGNVMLTAPILIIYIFLNKQIKKAFAYSGIK
ncbi:carbohydrate ABC transporter permease [Asaccharospora irregularis]|uniref:Carbohydrate ABC transporter membrane protein 2, CUT1 family n=1 Tax=Asaccharospora irregularis DSM 2635 TaxID=1121321 RepID=A0A1M5ST94_9FIRM|nr:carbohydrate ABC transporter permease [Asaccharospora irregularis]SHH41761.1 carbohydrate ABC transporter membrane protein 2, CUT1 family [Asaccharospora irregularis DSM 2635]